MLVKFQIKSQATITLFGDVAVTLIKLMGHSGTEAERFAGGGCTGRP